MLCGPQATNDTRLKRKIWIIFPHFEYGNNGKRKEVKRAIKFPLLTMSGPIVFAGTVWTKKPQERKTKINFVIFCQKLFCFQLNSRLRRLLWANRSLDAPFPLKICFVVKKLWLLLFLWTRLTSWRCPSPTSVSSQTHLEALTSS